MYGVDVSFIVTKQPWDKLKVFWLFYVLRDLIPLSNFHCYHIIICLHTFIIYTIVILTDTLIFPNGEKYGEFCDILAHLVAVTNVFIIQLVST